MKRFLNLLVLSWLLSGGHTQAASGDFVFFKERASGPALEVKLTPASDNVLCWVTGNIGQVSRASLFSTFVGTASITTLGTVTTGVWQGTDIADAYIASATTWSAKQPAGNYITALTGDVTTAAGPGSVAATVVRLNGVSLAGLATGLLKNTTTTGVPSIAAAGTDYQTPLTFSTGLTNTGGTITVNAVQSLTRLSNLTTNGFVKTSGADGTLSVDTASYQPSDSDLTIFAGITPSANVQSLLSAANYAAVLSLLSLGNVENAAASGLYVPLTRTVNGLELSGNITITTITGNAGTATALATGRAINGVTFDGTAAITVTAASGTLTGTTLAANVVASSLTSVGTLSAGAVPTTLLTGTITNAQLAGSIDLTTKVTGVLPATNGGTGQSTLALALAALATASTGTVEFGADVDADATDIIIEGADGITGSNRNGADVTIKSGDSTGTGGSKVRVFSSAPGATGTGTRTATERVVIDHNGVLIENTTAPTANPPVGAFYLYVDPGTNELVARGSSGTITILASP